jgi:hypothetical protein
VPDGPSRQTEIIIPPTVIPGQQAGSAQNAAEIAALLKEYQSARAQVGRIQASINAMSWIERFTNPDKYRRLNSDLQNWLGILREAEANYNAARGFAGGGFTGRGGKMQPAGIVHRGEYVIPKQFVNQSSGMPDPSFLAQLQNGMRSYQVGGFVGPSSQAATNSTMMVELSPYDRKLLADVGNVQLRLNGKVVAEATNRSNFVDAQRGTN